MVRRTAITREEGVFEFEVMTVMHQGVRPVLFPACISKTVIAPVSWGDTLSKEMFPPPSGRSVILCMQHSPCHPLPLGAVCRQGEGLGGGRGRGSLNLK